MFLVYHLIQMMWSQKVDQHFRSLKAFGEAYGNCELLLSCNRGGGQMEGSNGHKRRKESPSSFLLDFTDYITMCMLQKENPAWPGDKLYLQQWLHCTRRVQIRLWMDTRKGLHAVKVSSRHSLTYQFCILVTGEVTCYEDLTEYSYFRTLLLKSMTIAVAEQEGHHMEACMAVTCYLHAQ